MIAVNVITLTGGMAASCADVSFAASLPLGLTTLPLGRMLPLPLSGSTTG